VPKSAQTRSKKHHPAANANQETNKTGPEIVNFRPSIDRDDDLGHPGASGPSRDVGLQECDEFFRRWRVVVWNYVTQPISAILGVAEAFECLIAATIYGAIMGAVYRPAVAR